MDTKSWALDKALQYQSYIGGQKSAEELVEVARVFESYIVGAQASDQDKPSRAS